MAGRGKWEGRIAPRPGVPPAKKPDEIADGEKETAMEYRSGWLAKICAARPPELSLMRRLIGGRAPVPPAPFDFDARARDLAGGLSRREALRRVGVGLAAGLLSALGL